MDTVGLPFTCYSMFDTFYCFKTGLILLRHENTKTSSITRTGVGIIRLRQHLSVRARVQIDG
jgi:hypothetical protein